MSMSRKMKSESCSLDRGEVNDIIVANLFYPPTRISLPLTEPRGTSERERSRRLPENEKLELGETVFSGSGRVTASDLYMYES